MTIVKICGNTSYLDARCAAEAGADLLGFIFFAKSPRQVAPAIVGDILLRLRADGFTQLAVGVFVNASAAEIADTVHVARLDALQLHGDEPPQEVRGRAFKAIKRLDVRTPEYIAAARGQPLDMRLPELLIDADHPTLYGGSGQRADEGMAYQLARSCRLLLAGGLNVENVVAAISRVRPWGVDVASGTEAAPGRKDHAKLRAFIQAVKQLRD